MSYTAVVVMPTDQPICSDGAEVLALRRLSRSLAEVTEGESTEAVLHDLRASAQGYLQGCRDGHISDHLAGIHSHEIFIGYIDALIADGALLRRWLEREDISGVLSERVSSAPFRMPGGPLPQTADPPTSICVGEFKLPSDD